MQYLLAIESTCDETAVAIIDEVGNAAASVVASQESWHASFDGVVPEIAARAHLVNLLPVLDAALRQSRVEIQDIAAIVVASEPGLPGSLLVGLSAAKALCLAWDKPLVGINHVHAHIYACQLGQAEPVFPCVGLVVSGGHTNLYDCASCLDWKYLGGTIDDAAGEAFDKVAVLLGLPFPGGPQLARLAQAGDPTAHDLPRPLLHDKSRLDFSFSGLKTAVRYLLFGTGRSTTTTRVWSQKEKADLAASFQQAVVDCLVGKAIQAVQQTGRKWLCVGGGVAANTALRAQLASACQHRDIQLAIADPSLCTDNAVMGGLAWHRVRKRNFDELDLDIHSGLMRSPDWL